MKTYFSLLEEILKNSIMPIIELCKNEKVIQNKNITFLKAVSTKLEKIQKINSESKQSEPTEDSTNQESSNNSNQSMTNQPPTENQKTSEAS